MKSGKLALAAFEASGPDAGEAPKAQAQVFKFLMGTDELDGVWFGDPPPDGARKFWWRDHLRAALATPPLQEQDKRDAERYRKLRDSGDESVIVIDSIYPFSIWENSHWLKQGKKFDAAVDAIQAKT